METIFTLLDSLDTPTFYGVNNANILCLKNQHPDVRVVARGYQVKVTGAEKAVEQFEKSLRLCEQFCVRNNRLTEQDILMLLHGDKPHEQATDNLILHGVNGKSIYARSTNQQALVRAYEENDLLFAVGPAGTGKTYIAIALAVRALKNREIKRIILTRPAVEAGERLGFLPGDLKDKLDPYLQPLYDALSDMIPSRKLQEFMAEGTIQIAPLAYMRGRTLDRACVILDEAQNTNIGQLKMFLTRMGSNAKFLVTGDATQVDLPRRSDSGLLTGIRLLSGIKGITTIRFSTEDIVRHPLVTKIVRAFEDLENPSSLGPADNE